MSNTSLQRSLELAHRCIDWALQFDYLSLGVRRTLATRAQRPPARNAPPGARRDLIRQYLTEISRRKRLSSSEEYRLSRAARQGDPAARRQLIEHHLRLVVMLARRYAGRGLPQLDLIEEGNLGLMMAVERFDPEKGCRFSTYAKFWIRQSMELALMTQPGVVHLPVHVSRAMKRHGRQIAAGTRDNLTRPRKPAESTPSLRGQTAFPGAAGEILTREWRYLLYDIRNVRTQAERDLPTDRALACLAGPEHDRPDWAVLRAGERQELELAMALLKPIEREVLRARFGLADDRIRTLQTIAAELSLSAERVRQIQGEAIGKLRQILSTGSANRVRG